MNRTASETRFSPAVTANAADRRINKYNTSLTWSECAVSGICDDAGTPFSPHSFICSECVVNDMYNDSHTLFDSNAILVRVNAYALSES